MAEFPQEIIQQVLLAAERVVVERGVISVPQLRTTGISSASLAITLPKNAVVDVFDIVVAANRAGSAPVSTVAQVRSSGSGPSSKVVIDFGTPRTVSALEIATSDVINEVKPWVGMQFGEKLTVNQSLVTLEVQSAQTTTQQTVRSAVFDSEIRTERLLVDFTANVDIASLVDALSVVLTPTAFGSRAANRWRGRRMGSPGTRAARRRKRIERRHVE